jgi:hypothetical protein
MPRATRSTGASSKETPKADSAKGSRYKLPISAENPPKLFVLPQKVTAEARIVTLPNPRYSKPTRYLICPETGFYEFTTIAAPPSTPRSWLIEGQSGDGDDEDVVFETQTMKNAAMHVASPIDPLFLVLPALAAQPKMSSKSDAQKRMFLSSDDHFDSLPQDESHLSEILKWGQTRQVLEARMAVVCDTVDAGDESMFRLNEEKLAEELLSKARMMSEGGLPKSMEEKFVTKALEAPVMSRKTKAPTPDTSAPTSQLDSLDSQSSASTVDTSVTSFSEVSTTATSVADETEHTGIGAAANASAEVTRLQQLRVAFDFICASYLPPALTKVLKKLLPSQAEVDFKPLDEYLAHITKLRQEAALLRAASDLSSKRGRDEEEEEERAEKRRKKEEDDKRKKAGESRGVRELKKVNVAGMKKMSDFFKKK